jgi:LPXTG-site transpeptidase (sortase) family protein
MDKKDYLIIGVTTLVIFAATYAVLSIVGLVPQELAPTVTEEVSNTEIQEEYLEDDDIGDKILFPDRISIEKIGVESVIQKPQSQEVPVLDEALKKGAVYYPGSGTLAFGNMFLFGHSTNWQIVNNQAYKTFNGLEDLVEGDEITIEAKGKTFIYKVDNVKLLEDNAAFVDFSGSERMLTLSTCNTFGKKQDRWVVEARFDGEI